VVDRYAAAVSKARKTPRRGATYEKEGTVVSRPTVTGRPRMEVDPSRVRGEGKQRRLEKEERLLDLQLEEAEHRKAARTTAEQPAAKTRRRPPNALPPEKVEELEPMLLERIAALDSKQKAPPHLTHEAIAIAVGEPFNRQRVPQGEQLLRVGWPMSRSHPDFSTTDAVRWPNPRDAASILASERAAEG
jgi:hypothetical protein